jgi:pyruvate kinase
MALPRHKTKIVATVGPASDSPEMLRRLISAGMNIVRLNFSHGDFSGHAATIARVREAAGATGCRVAIMADLPGPKMRIGRFESEPVRLTPDGPFTLTTDERVVGTAERVSVSFPALPTSVRPGDRLFLNDGYIEVEVVRVEGTEVICRVRVGGELRSRKGLNLPGIDLGISAFTPHDRRCLEFALQHGVDAISQSFVDRAADIAAVRAAAAEMGHHPFIIAKVERSGALERIQEILAAADGIMVARGDLGVEIPIEEMAIAQKRLMQLANRACKPVITATQMLESMIGNRLPTRAEATDVANAILDGTDCVMLSGESAVGQFPAEAVGMLAKIAAATEVHRARFGPARAGEPVVEESAEINPEELVAASVETTIHRITPATVIVPTHSGATARSIARFHLPVWVTAVSSQEKTCQDLQFSYGVCGVCEGEHPDNWRTWGRRWRDSHKLQGRYLVLTEGPSRKHPDRNHRMEIIDLNA